MNEGSEAKGKEKGRKGRRSSFWMNLNGKIKNRGMEMSKSNENTIFRGIYFLNFFRVCSVLQT